MKVFKRKKIQIKSKSFIILIILFIISNTIYLLFLYNKYLTPKINKYSYDVIYKFTYQNITNYLTKNITGKKELDDILIVSKNNEGEILTVDFDLNKAYEINEKVTKILQEKILAFESGIPLDNNLNITSAKKGFQINVPLFIGSNYTIISSFGPTIPIKIAFIGAIETNLKTSVKSYGLNNSLAEIAVIVKINENLITPIGTENMSLYYEFLIDSKLINGRVPSFYGTEIKSESNVFKRIN